MLSRFFTIPFMNPRILTRMHVLHSELLPLHGKEPREIQKYNNNFSRDNWKGESITPMTKSVS